MKILKLLTLVLVLQAISQLSLAYNVEDNPTKFSIVQIITEFATKDNNGIHSQYCTGILLPNDYNSNNILQVATAAHCLTVINQVMDKNTLGSHATVFIYIPQSNINMKATNQPRGIDSQLMLKPSVALFTYHSLAAGITFEMHNNAYTQDLAT